VSHIIRSVEINADIDEVWGFLTESDKIAMWLMPNTFEAVADQYFTMDCPPEAGTGEKLECQINEIELPANGNARLEYSWRISNPPTETLVEVNLIEVAGVTRLDLVHSGWEEGESELRSRHAMGWDHFLGTVLKGH
jgi:uncharacterized protein YndB with AHSA1/START domain